MLYYPGTPEDVLLYGEAPKDGVVTTLPRLLYNMWLVLCAAASVVGLVVYVALRQRWYAERILRVTRVPICLTVTIALCAACLIVLDRRARASIQTVSVVD